MKSMRILMIAPQPVFSPRGTPFSVVHRARALIHLGHRVDLLTYPFGTDMEIDGLRIFRCRRPFGIHDMPMGPSVRKLRTDLVLAMQAWRMATSGDYDLVHTHEEAGAIGAALRRRTGMTHLYDMHSSLPQQFHNFGRYDYRPVVGVFERLERFMLFGADGVIVICQSLGDRAREVGYPGPMQLIENTLDFVVGADIEDRIPALRERLGVGEGPVLVYTGSLERYQGLELLIDAMIPVAAQVPHARLIIVGGTSDGSAAMAQLARRKGVADQVMTVPAVLPHEVHLYHRLADILVTTRTHGTNTPLKLYQYLRSGRPMVATSIFSHTQVLDDDCAQLVSPEPDDIARGILRLIADPGRREQLARTAMELAEREYGEDAYHRRLAALLEDIHRPAGSKLLVAVPTCVE